MADISVIGSGSWGTAVTYLLAKNGHSVKLWSYFAEESQRLARERENKEFLPGVILPDTVLFTNDIKEALMGSELVITAVPSHAMRTTAEAMKPFIDTRAQTILNISKGLEEGTMMRLSQVITDCIPSARVAVMSGPSHAEEVGKLMPTTNVVSCKDIALAKRIQNIMMSPTFRVYTNTDMIGVELGGSLKNVIALCAGIVDGLGFGDNTKAALMTRGIAEISRLGTVMGANPDTFAGLSGIGDLIVTCTSMHSRNRRAGILIGQGKNLSQALEEVHMVVEGVRTAAAAHALAEKYEVEMPICREAYLVLFEGKSAREAVNDLMLRSKKHESAEREYLNG